MFNGFGRTHWQVYTIFGREMTFTLVLPFYNGLIENIVKDFILSMHVSLNRSGIVPK